MNSSFRHGLVGLLGLALAPVAHAGGFIKVSDITGRTPSPIPGHLIARQVPIRWDDRCLPVPFSLNNTLDPVPNPLGAPVVSLASADSALRQAMATWTDIPTSYAGLRLANTVGNPGFARFDTRHELTFRAPSAFNVIATTPSFALLEDTSLVDGQDLDGDGDADVRASILTCTDVDSDGDLEFPAGTYRAGTVVDVDVIFNSEDFRFTVGDAAVDTNALSVDLLSVAVHEFGHSLGLSHTLDNTLSSTDGTPSTMYPFVDTGDPGDEIGKRSLGEDDVATLSLHYPEGTSSSGPAAIQHGDVPFRLVYGRLRGKVTHGEQGLPVAGASIAAENLLTGRLAAAAFSGRSQVSFDPVTQGLFLVDQAFNILDGNYELALPLGLYRLRIEATDGFPVAGGNIGINEQIGGLFGQMCFDEEYWTLTGEDNSETRPGLATPVVAIPSLTFPGLDFVTNLPTRANTFNAINGFGFIAATPGTYYAARIPAALISATNQGQGVAITSGDFFTALFDTSVVPRFAEAMLTTGTLAAGTASLDLENPLRRTSGFVGQELDFAPFYFSQSVHLGEEILERLEDGTLGELFLVLRVPTTSPYPGANGAAPVVGFSSLGPISGNSYISTDGITFTQRSDLDFAFRLVMTSL